MVQLEHWGCPWSRKDDGAVNVRFFGGMKSAAHLVRRRQERLPHAAHVVPDLAAVSVHQALRRVLRRRPDGRGRPRARRAGASRSRSGAVRPLRVQGGDPVHRRRRPGLTGQNTNAGIVTGDGMGHGLPRTAWRLRDMEFVQYHPTALPGTGILITEGCRGEGGDPGQQGTATATCRTTAWARRTRGRAPKAMELGPRDRLSQAFWHEEQKGNTVEHAAGHAVQLDLRHLGAEEDPRAPAADHRSGRAPLPASTRSRSRCRCARPCTTRWAASHCNRVDRDVAAGAVRRRRMLQRGHPRRQPAGLQFAGRDRGVRQASRASAPRRSRAARPAAPADAAAPAGRSGGGRGCWRLLGRDGRASAWPTLRDEHAATAWRPASASSARGRGMRATCDKLAAAARTLAPRRSARRPQPRLQHRMAVGDRAGLHARGGRGDGAFGAAATRIARRARAARRVRDARRRALPHAHAGAPRRRRRRRDRATRR